MNLLRTTLASLLGLTAAGGLVWLLGFSPYLRVESFTVEGSRRAELSELRHLSNVVAGSPLVTVDLDAVARGVERHPWVHSARVRRSFPNGVVVTVEERVPVAIVNLDGLFLVDAEGEVFSRAQAGDLDHPVLSGLDPQLAQREPEVARRLVREGIARLVALRSAAGLQDSEFSELHFDAAAGYTLYLRNGGEVLLGFAEPERSSRLALLSKQGLDLAVPHRVDLASDRLAVVTPL